MDAPISPQITDAPKQSGTTGFVIATVLILALILIGAGYFWKARGANDAALQSIQNQSESDAVLDIEADLNATNIDSVDYDLDESNFNAS